MRRCTSTTVVLEARHAKRKVVLEARQWRVRAVLEARQWRVRAVLVARRWRDEEVWAQDGFAVRADGLKLGQGFLVFAGTLPEFVSCPKRNNASSGAPPHRWFDPSRRRTRVQDFLERSCASVQTGRKKLFTKTGKPAELCTGCVPNFLQKFGPEFCKTLPKILARILRFITGARLHGAQTRSSGGHRPGPVIDPQFDIVTRDNFRIFLCAPWSLTCDYPVVASSKKKVLPPPARLR